MADRLLYISPHFPPNYQQFIFRLQQAGIQVFGVATDDEGRLPHELRGALTGYYRVHDAAALQQYFDAVRYFQHHFGPVDRVESHAEFYLPIEAAIRDEFKIPGKGGKATEEVRKKSLMKEGFARAKIETASALTASNLSSALAFAERVGYPLIAKPDGGVGASATFTIDSSEALARFFSWNPEQPYLLEQFIQGEIETFDGLTDQDGNVVYYNSIRYNKGIMEIVNDDDELFYYTARTMPEDLIAAGLRAVRAFDIREKFFHIEFFRRNDGSLLGLELNMRPPGGLTTDMWNYADDIDLYFQWAQIVRSNSFDAVWERRYHVMYVGRKNRYQHVLSDDAISSSFRDSLLLRTSMPELFQRALGDTGYILRSADLEQLRQIAVLIQQKAY